jgi:hypothetical protein
VIRAEVAATPNAPVVPDVFLCPGESTTLSVSTPGIQVARWYDINDNFLQEGDNFTVSNPPPGITQYRVRLVQLGETITGECESPVELVNVNVTDPGSIGSPTLISMPPICGSGGTTTIEVGGGADYNWYNFETSSTVIATGPTFTTPPLGSSEDYFVSLVTSSGCESSSRLEVRAVVEDIPSEPITDYTNTCDAGFASATVLDPLPGGSVFWYDNEEGGIPLSSQTTFQAFLNDGENRVLWVESVSAEGCASDRQRVSLSSVPTPTAPEITAENITSEIVYDLATENITYDIVLCEPSTIDFLIEDDGGALFFNVERNGVVIEEEAYLFYNGVVIDQTNTTIAFQGHYDGECYGGRQTFRFTIDTPPPAPLVTSDNVVCGSGSNTFLTALGTPPSGILEWRDLSGNVLATGESFDFGPVTADTDLQIFARNFNGCYSDPTDITVTVNDLPQAPEELLVMGDPTPNDRCGPGNILLERAPRPGGDFFWYTTRTGGTPIPGGNETFNTGTLNEGIYTYYVEYVDEFGCISPRSEVTAVVHPIPAAPSVTEPVRCGPGVVTLEASGGPAGSTYNWYDIGSNLLATDVTFSPDLTESVTQYFVETVSPEGCVSATRTAAVARVNNPPGIPVLVSNPVICDGIGTTNITVSGGVTGSAYNWYETEVDDTPIFTGSIFTTPELIANTDFYVTILDPNGCESEDRLRVEAIVRPVLEAPVAVGDVVCGSGSLNLSVDNPQVEGEYRW